MQKGYRKDRRVTKQVLVPVADAASDALWEASVKKDAQRKREDLNALRLQYHTEQADRHRRTLSRLVQFHEGQVEKLAEGEA